MGYDREATQRWRDKYPEKSRQSVREWRQRNYQRVLIWNATYRARRIGNKGAGVSFEQWQQIVKKFNARCAYCRAPYECMDHVIALARGGAHDVQNVVPCCAACNRKKRDELPDANLLKMNRLQISSKNAKRC